MVALCIPESGPRASLGLIPLSINETFLSYFFLRTVRVTKLKPGTHMESGLMYHVYWTQGQGPITHGVKSLDRFYVSMLLFPPVMLSGKHKLKIFQYYRYFSSDSAAVGL